MKLLPVRAAVAAAIAVGGLLAGSAYAAPLYFNAATATMGSPATFSDSFSSAAAGTAVLSFDVLGTGSMDGDNYYIDVFGLTVNGTQLLQGAFNMSGGGDSKLFFAPVGTVWNTATNTCNGCNDPNYQGGTTHISLSIALLAGINTLAFNYDSPPSSMALTVPAPKAQAMSPGHWPT
jgi:hypothetical protein